MKEFSKEIIEIDGVEYTLFLNRKGIIAFEKFSREEKDKAKELENKYKELANNSNEIKEIEDNTNPFDGINDIDNDIELLNKIYKKLYWIMMYEEHKLSFNQASDLYDKACEEYGEVNIIALGNQMVNDANKDNVSKKELKNLTALRPQK